MKRYTINQLLNISDQMMFLTKRDEMVDIVREIKRYTTRRYNALLKKGMRTPAFKGFEESGGIIKNVEELSLNKLRQEFVRGRMFLEAKTSTVEGSKKILNAAYKRMGLSKSFPQAIFWRIYEKLIEIRRDYGTRQSSQRIQEELAIFINAFNKRRNSRTNPKYNNDFEYIVTSLRSLEYYNNKTKKTKDDEAQMQALEHDIVQAFIEYMDGDISPEEVFKEKLRLDRIGGDKSKTTFEDDLAMIRRGGRRRIK